MTDPITEADLHAFVDDQLPAERRLEVEDYLAGHPEVAARVMADLRARDALKLAFERTPARRPDDVIFEAARRLERGLVWRRIGAKLRRVASVAILVGAGWFAHAHTGLLEVTDTEASPQPPAFVEDARHAHETSLIRARMVSQPEAPDYDPQEILAETGIALPLLPKDWRVTDAQIFPARYGHSLEIAVDAGSLGRLSLFAGRVPSFGVIRPTLARSESAVTAYWQSGELVYALTGSGSDTAIERAASRLTADLR
jgi:anti-sigma factor RsiW